MIAPLVLALIVRATNPCLLLEPREIAQVLGWSVASGVPRTYKLPNGAGKMCTFEGRDGTVLVTIPTKGTGLPVNDLTSDVGPTRTPMHDAFGFGTPIELGRGSAIVHDRGADYGISVAPIDAQFTDDVQMRALVKALVAHLPHRHHKRAA